MALTIDDKRKDFFNVINARVKGAVLPTRPKLTDKQFGDFTLLTDLTTRLRTDLRIKGIDIALNNEQIVEALPVPIHGGKTPVDIKNTVNFYLDSASVSPLLDTSESRTLIKDLMDVVTKLNRHRRGAPTFINLLSQIITTRMKIVDAISTWGEINGTYVILIDNRIMVLFKPIEGESVNSVKRDRGYMSVIEVGGYLSNYWNFCLLGENNSRIPHYAKYVRQKRGHQSVGTMRVIETNPTKAWQVKVELNPAGFWGDTVDTFDFNNFTATQTLSPSAVLDLSQYNEMLGK